MNDEDRAAVIRACEAERRGHELKEHSSSQMPRQHSHCIDCGKMLSDGIYYNSKWNPRLCSDCNFRHEGPLNASKGKQP